ncbi:MAG: PQQ-binding-like beta-propeller repeat protein [Planctomycetota bacterium]
MRSFTAAFGTFWTTTRSARSASLPQQLQRALKVSLLVIGAAAATAVQAQEWTRFRGPEGTGVSEVKNIPAKWTDADYNWKAKLPGIGHSSPVIWGDKIFLLSADPKTATRHVLALDVGTGKALWQRDYESKPHHLHARSSYASCTPAVDAERVYVAWSDPDHTWLKALDHSGKELWTADFGPWQSQHGFGSSPILSGDLVILSCSQEISKLKDTPDPKDSFVVGVDQRTGAVRWKTPRKIDTTSYSVPFLRRGEDGREEVVCCTTAEGFFALEPQTGKEKWTSKVFDKRTVSSPFQAGGLIFGTTGSGGGGNYVVALQPGANPKVVYEVRKEAPYVPSPVARGELLFLWSDKGIVTCVNLADGATIWQKRVNGGFSGSPIRIHDKIYCISEEGDVVVLAAEREFQELGRNPLGEETRSTPAVSGGRLYLRSNSTLFSLGGKAS